MSDDPSLSGTISEVPFLASLLIWAFDDVQGCSAFTFTVDNARSGAVLIISTSGDSSRSGTILEVPCLAPLEAWALFNVGGCLAFAFVDSGAVAGF
jgi:hypothetical protein